MTGRIIFPVTVLFLRCALAALPTSFNATEYSLSLTVPSSVTVGSALQASAVITLVCAQATSTLTLHWGSSLSPSTPTIANISMIYDGTTSLTEGSDYNVTRNDTLETVTFTLFSNASVTSFSKGAKVAITLKYFEVTVNEDLKGVFLRHYPNSDGSNGTVLATQVWPTHARQVLPCLDEPRYNATWTLEITRPSSWGVAASFNLTDSAVSSSDSSVTQDTYSATTVLPPSALSFFLSPNMTSSNYSRANYSTTLTFWSGQDLTGTGLTNNMTFLAEMFYLIDDLLNTNFTLTGGVLHIVLVPNLETAFSGLGIVFIRQDAYYGSYSSATLEGLFKMRVMPVLTQMLRQYAGFSTWPETWSDAWITEAVAEYLKYVVITNMGVPFDFAADLEVVGRQRALSQDTSGSNPLHDTSINVNSSAAVLSSLTDPLKRTKGAVLLNMLDMSFPAGNILASIKTLLSTKKGSSVNTTYFSQLIQNTTKAINNYLSNGTTTALQYIPLWFNNSGYPLINVTATEDGVPGTVSVLMSQFCGASSCSSSLPMWYVSATVGSHTEPRYLVTRQDFWVTNSSSAVSDSLDITTGDWVVANMRAAGYYRASYNETLWTRAVSTVAEGLDEPPGRSQLIDDAFALSAAGLLDYNTTLCLAVANFQETLYSNWYPVHSGLWDLRDRLWNTSFYSTFKTYTTALLKNVDTLLQSGTVHVYELSRIYSMFFSGMCEMDISQYRNYAMANLTTLLQGNLTTSVDSSSYDAMVCCAAQYNTSLNATALWSTVSNFSASHYSKHFSAVALGCLDNYTSVSSLFSTMLNSSTQYKLYITTTFMNLAENHPANLTANLSSIAENLETKLGAATLASIIFKAGKKLDSTQASSMSTALNATSVDDVVKIAGGKVLTAASEKTSWLASYNSSVIAALESNVASTTMTSAATTSTRFTLLCLLPMLLFTSGGTKFSL